MGTKSREVRLASRPAAMPAPEHFEIAETLVPDPGEGEIQVRNLFMSVDPYMRGRMRDVKSYVPPFEVGKVMDGGAVGEVVASRNPRFADGDLVVGMQGWREVFNSDGTGLQKIDKSLGVPPSAYLGVLGMPGLTAYVGLFDIGKLQPGETLMVSGAAGAVGSLVGQLGKTRDCRVVGSAGSPEKVRFLIDELGFDDAFDYRRENLNEALARTCPHGVDVYFENVGGALLEAVLLHMRPFGRIPVCGMISQYNESEPAPGPRTLVMVIPRRLRIQGFIVSDHWDRQPAFLAEVAPHVRDGRIRFPETVVSGIENAPDAFIGLFRGENTGKMLVRLAGDDSGR
jgi:hypothetical protein